MDFCPKIGVVIPEGPCAWWQGEALRLVRQVRPEAAALRARVPETFPGGPFVRRMARLERLFSRPKPDILGPASEAALPAIRSALPLGQARNLGLDLLIAPRGVVLPDGFLASLRLGLWELDVGRPGRLDRGVAECRLLWRRAGQPDRVALATATCVQDVLPLAWLGPHLAKAAHLPSRALTRLALLGAAWRDSCPLAEPDDPPDDAAPVLPGRPDNPAALPRFLAVRAWRDLGHDRQWFLAARPGDGDPLRPGFASEPFTPLTPPPVAGWADPCLVRHGDALLCFIEEITPSGKGVIAVLERRGRDWTAPRRVLEEPFHLSYPFVFQWDGQWWMIPESGQAGRVALYRAEAFPDRWALDRALLSGAPFLDATPFQHEGLWWLSVTRKIPGGSSWDELDLYHAPSPLGPFTPHPLNPVASDVRRARPAGRPFSRHGRLYRPVQDCSGWYGRALNLMEVTRLDATAFEEHRIARLTAATIPDSFCLHTFTALDGIEIVDGQRLLGRLRLPRPLRWGE